MAHPEQGKWEGDVRPGPPTARRPVLRRPGARVAASGWDGQCTGPGLGQTVCPAPDGVVVVVPTMAEAEDPWRKQVLPTLGVQMVWKLRATGRRTQMLKCVAEVTQGEWLPAVVYSVEDTHFTALILGVFASFFLKADLSFSIYILIL